MAAWLKKLLRCLFARGIPYHREKSKHNLQPAIWVLGFILTQGIAFFVAVQGTERQSIIRENGVTIEPLINVPKEPQTFGEYIFPFFGSRLALYFWASIATLGVLVGIIGSQHKDPPRFANGDGRRYRTFDAPTVRFTWWVFGWGCAFVFFFFCAGYTKSLPGQVVDVKPTEFLPYDFKSDKSKGIQVFVRFRVREFPKNSNVLYFEVKLDDVLSRNWKIANVLCYVGKREVENNEAANILPVEDNGTQKVKLFNPKKGELYRFRFLLHEKAGKSTSRDEALSHLKKDKKAFRFGLAPSQE